MGVKKQRHESKFYTIIKHTFEQAGGFYLKVPDSFGQTEIKPGERKPFRKKNPYDLQLLYQGINLYCEVKYYPEIKAFSLGNLADHQVENLQLVQNNRNEHTVPLVALGVYKAREIKRLYLFDFDWLKNHPLKKQDLVNINCYVNITSRKIKNSEGKDVRVDMMDIATFFDSIYGLDYNELKMAVK